MSESVEVVQPAGVSADEVGLWDAIRESLRGSHRDYTEGAVSRAIFLLAIPMVLEMVMESVFAVCDVFFVSKLGASAVASVGLTESWLTIVYAVAMGLAIAATAIVARRVGERDHEAAARSAVQAMLFGLAVATVLGIVGATLGPSALRLMGAAPDVLATGGTYARIMLGGNITIMMLFLINAIFRGAGDAAIAMRVLWLANGINIVLGPCLIFGLGPFPRLGVAGAAVATNIGRGTGALFAASRLLRGDSRIVIHKRHLRIDFGVLGGMLRLAWSASLQLLIGIGSWIALIRILSTYGSDALAGYTIGIRMVIFALLPSEGIANAAATMVGQALGAGKPERAERAVKLAGLYNMFVLGAVGVLLMVFARPIAQFFTNDAAVVPHATNCLRIVSTGFVLYGWGMVFGQAFNGAGDTWTPTWLNLVVFWVWEVPLGYLLAKHAGMGPRGVYVAIAIAFSTYAVAAGALFRRGRWKTRTV